MLFRCRGESYSYIEDIVIQRFRYSISDYDLKGASYSFVTRSSKIVQMPYYYYETYSGYNRFMYSFIKLLVSNCMNKVWVLSKLSVTFFLWKSMTRAFSDLQSAILIILRHSSLNTSKYVSGYRVPFKSNHR